MNYVSLSLLGRFLVLTAALIANFPTLATQERTAADAPTPISKVSFTLLHNRVYVPVEVNGRGHFEMVLDNGAVASGLSEESVRSLGLQAKGKAQLTGNGESRQKISITRNVTFRLGSAGFVEKSVAIVPFEELETHEGRTIAGVLGVNLFRRYVIAIDYRERTLTLYEPQTFIYHGQGEVVPLHMAQAALFRASIELADSDSLECHLAVDSGTYSALRLYQPYVQKHHLTEGHRPSIDSFGFGLGGEFPEKLGRVALLRIGSLGLKEPTTSFSVAKRGATSTDAYDGTIGGALLSRFRVILDYPHQKMILEPSADFSAPFAADTSGLILGASGPGYNVIYVLHVLANTPASEVGIREGDTVVKVNGHEASSLGLESIRDILLKTGAYYLQLRRGMQDLEIDMKTVAPLY